MRRDDGSDTLNISRPLPGREAGLRDLHLLETDEDREMLLGFEQAVLAALPNPQWQLPHGPLHGPIDAAFWTSLDALFRRVYTQSFETLTVDGSTGGSGAQA